MTGTSTEEKGIVMDDMRYDVAVVGAGQAGLERRVVEAESVDVDVRLHGLEL
jgi:hypothetical protein